MLRETLPSGHPALATAPARVEWVDTPVAVEVMRHAVLGDHALRATSSSSGSSSDGSSSGSGSVAGANGATVVGLDCEWAPYERRQARTPVALLQVGGSGKVGGTGEDASA